MNNRIMDAIFDSWCEGECGQHTELPEVQETIDGISERFQASRAEKLYIEKSVTELVCLYERNAFMEGLRVCMELLNGTMFKTCK